MPDKPWGPQGEGEWVEVTHEMLEELTFPCWTDSRFSFPCWFETRAGANTIYWVEQIDANLVEYKALNGTVSRWPLRDCEGDYVWVPATEQKPSPESPEARPDWVPEGWDLVETEHNKFPEIVARRCFACDSNSFIVGVTERGELTVIDESNYFIHVPTGSPEAAFAAAEALACGRWVKEDGQ